MARIEEKEKKSAWAWLGIGALGALLNRIRGGLLDIPGGKTGGDSKIIDWAIQWTKDRPYLWGALGVWILGSGGGI